MNYFFDTNGIIYLLSNKGNFPEFLSNDKFYVSFITYIELFVGINDEDTKKEIRDFLSDFEIVYCNSEITEKSLEIRKSLKLKIPDAIISSSAILMNSILITADIEMIKKLANKVTIFNPLA